MKKKKKKKKKQNLMDQIVVFHTHKQQKEIKGLFFQVLNLVLVV